MAYKRRLSKKKKWTGDELGRLELAQYAYNFERQGVADKDHEEETLFDMERYLEILRETTQNDAAASDAFENYRRVERWLSRAYNASWGYYMQADFALGLLDSIYESMGWAAAGIVGKNNAGSNIPLREMLKTAAERYRLNVEQASDCVLSITHGLDNLKAYNAAIEITAKHYKVPELSVFRLNVDDLKSCIFTISERAADIEKIIEGSRKEIAQFLTDNGITLFWNMENEAALHFPFVEMEVLLGSADQEPYTSSDVKIIVRALKRNPRNVALYSENHILGQLLRLSTMNTGRTMPETVELAREAFKHENSQ